MAAPVVTVRGEARLEVPPDLATMSVTVHGTGSSADAGPRRVGSSVGAGPRRCWRTSPPPSRGSAPADCTWRRCSGTGREPRSPGTGAASAPRSKCRLRRPVRPRLRPDPTAEQPGRRAVVVAATGEPGLPRGPAGRHQRRPPPRRATTPPPSRCRSVTCVEISDLDSGGLGGSSGPDASVRHGRRRVRPGLRLRAGCAVGVGPGDRAVRAELTAGAATDWAVYRRGNTRPIDSRHVPQGAGGQSWRDRGAGLPRRLRARRADGRRLPVRGSQRRPPDQGRRGVPDRRAGAPGPGLPRHRGDHPSRADVRRRRHLSRLRLPEREPRSGPRLRRGRHHLHRPAGRRAAAGRQQGPGPGGREGGRHPDPEVDPALLRRRRPGGGGGGDRVPGLRQGGGRWWWSRHAPGGHPRRAARVVERGDAGGRGRLRRCDRLHRAGRRPAAAHRGADPGRYPGPRDAPLRAGLLDPAPPPEGRRDRPGAQHHRGAARGAVLGTRWPSPGR